MASELQALIDDLVAANHILYNQKVVDGYGHVSFRHPQNPERFFMAAAVSPGRVRASDIIELDLDGNKIEQNDLPTYSERFIHTEVYRAREDVHAVVHSHSPAVIPFGVTDVALRPIVHNASFLHTGVPVFNSRDVPEATTPLVNSAPVGKALAKALGRSSVVLMRGHGDTVVGETIREVVSHAIYTERNAQLVLQTLALGRPIDYMQDDESAEMGVRQNSGPGHGIDRVWKMWIDEVNASPLNAVLGR